MSPAAVLTATLPVYLTMLAGALARKFGWLKQESDAGIIQPGRWVRRLHVDQWITDLGLRMRLHATAG